jgi:hypothetical protein
MVEVRIEEKPYSEQATQKLFADDGYHWKTRSERYGQLKNSIFQQVPENYWVLFVDDKPVASQGVGKFEGYYLGLGVHTREGYRGKQDGVIYAREISKYVVDNHSDRPFIANFADPSAMSGFKKLGFSELTEEQWGELPTEVRSALEVANEKGSLGQLQKLWMKGADTWWLMIKQAQKQGQGQQQGQSQIVKPAGGATIFQPKEKMKPDKKEKEPEKEPDDDDKCQQALYRIEDALEQLGKKTIQEFKDRGYPREGYADWFTEGEDGTWEVRVAHRTNEEDVRRSGRNWYDNYTYYSKVGLAPEEVACMTLALIRHMFNDPEGGFEYNGKFSRMWVKEEQIKRAKVFDDWTLRLGNYWIEVKNPSGVEIYGLGIYGMPLRNFAYPGDENISNDYWQEAKQVILRAAG